MEGDILDLPHLTRAMEGVSTVFHLAANADVRGGMGNTAIDLEQNTIGTHRVLEAMRLAGAEKIVFTSSATVYGEPEVFPTPENYAPLQTSLYGASKLAAEAMVQATVSISAFKAIPSGSSRGLENATRTAWSMISSRSYRRIPEN